MPDTFIEESERPELYDPAVREGMLGSHPIVNKPYTVLTPMLQLAYRIFRERVWLKRTGSYLHAETRMGKTTCANAIRDLLGEEFPDIFVALMDADGGKGDIGMAVDLASALKLTVSKRPNYKALMERIILFIHSEVSVKGGNQFVLIIDEMQGLREGDYKVLLYLHNRLGHLGIMMTTLGFAQPDISEQRSALNATSSKHLIARFLAEPIKFNGCLSSEDLAFVLKGYDESKTYPLGSQWTFTRFFFPRAYDQGFRLSNFSELIWRELASTAASLGIGAVPMEHLTRVVESLLLYNRQKDCPEFSLSSEHIVSAIQASNLLSYVDALGYGK